ncbi:Verru_Chthon cassette protein D [Verrucomicrobiales bacterium]|nr:Verru_Chthon cassette protein D [Verrucomicrobiales bacterium]
MEHLKTKSPYCARSSGAFSLIETLAVLTIVSLLLSMSVLGINSIADSTDLTSNGDQIVSHLVQARQRALSDNAHVEVRIYPPLESAAAKQWMMVLARQGLEDSSSALQKPLILSDSIAISKSPVYSSLIALREKRQDETLMSRASGPKREYLSFRYFPDGSTNLPLNPNGDTWHLTVTSRKYIERAEAPLPDNFYTIRIDPFTGAVRAFRP